MKIGKGAEKRMEWRY